MTSHESKVTVVVPCFKQGAFLEECLRSLVNQTSRLWTCIVVDDGSPDDEVARGVEIVNDSRVMLITHEANRGLGAARNTGFRAANTELVLPVDSDDMLHPDFLQVTTEMLQRSPELDCAYTDFQLFGDSSDVWRYSVRHAADMARAQWIPGPGTVMRKRVWERNGGYDEVPPPYQGNEDWDFWISAVENGLRPCHIGRALYNYRRTEASMSATTLRYYEYQTRLRIYHRHKRFFRHNQATRTFLAEGCLKSSSASLKAKRHLRAAWFALHGLALAPGCKCLQRQLLISVALAPAGLFARSRVLMTAGQIRS